MGGVAFLEAAPPFFIGKTALFHSGDDIPLGCMVLRARRFKRRGQKYSDQDREPV
jgi:hypothetical protein